MKSTRAGLRWLPVLLLAMPVSVFAAAGAEEHTFTDDALTLLAQQAVAACPSEGDLRLALAVVDRIHR